MPVHVLPSFFVPAHLSHLFFFFSRFWSCCFHRLISLTWFSFTFTSFVHLKQVGNEERRKERFSSLFNRFYPRELNPSSSSLFTDSLHSLTRIQMQSDKRKERKRLSFNWKMERDRQEKREGREEKEKKIRTKKSPKERRG